MGGSPHVGTRTGQPPGLAEQGWVTRGMEWVAGAGGHDAGRGEAGVGTGTCDSRGSRSSNGGGGTGSGKNPPKPSRRETYGKSISKAAVQKKKEREQTAALKGKLEDVLTRLNLRRHEPAYRKNKQPVQHNNLLQDAVLAVNSVVSSGRMGLASMNDYRDSLLLSACTGVLLVRSSDLVVVESSCAMQVFSSAHHFRGYVGQSLRLMVHADDSGVMSDLEQAISRPCFDAQHCAPFSLRLIRTTFDEESGCMLVAYSRVNLEVAFKSEDDACALLLFNLSSQDTKPLSPGAAFWERYWGNLEKAQGMFRLDRLKVNSYSGASWASASDSSKTSSSSASHPTSAAEPVKAGSTQPPKSAVARTREIYAGTLGAVGQGLGPGSIAAGFAKLILSTMASPVVDWYVGRDDSTKLPRVKWDLHLPHVTRPMSEYSLDGQLLDMQKPFLEIPFVSSMQLAGAVLIDESDNNFKICEFFISKDAQGKAICDGVTNWIFSEDCMWLKAHNGLPAPLLINSSWNRIGPPTPSLKSLWKASGGLTPSIGMLSGDFGQDVTEGAFFPGLNTPLLETGDWIQGMTDRM
mmetsp:Transcript_31090/g.78257  ORF Transcript_31090/g.78257 Transcript_31090/m.78257 type:complete len:577 (-) Transcript_31090:296-2026(-)